MATCKIVLTKRFTFRGQPEEWSNGYLLQTGVQGATPPEADVRSAAMALWAMESAILSSDQILVKGVGGLLGDPAVWVEEWSDPQTQLSGGAGSGGQHPELCVLLEAKWRRRVYSRKWFHTKRHSGDALPGGEITTINGVFAPLTTGVGPHGWRYCNPAGQLLNTPFTCDPYVRTHQLKAGRRRPQ